MPQRTVGIIKRIASNYVVWSKPRRGGPDSASKDPMQADASQVLVWEVQGLNNAKIEIILPWGPDGQTHAAQVELGNNEKIFIATSPESLQNMPSDNAYIVRINRSVVKEPVNWVQVTPSPVIIMPPN